MGKFNEEQLKMVLEFMTKNPMMLQKRNRSNSKPRMQLWKELADKLNTQGPPYKSEIDWRRSWAKKKFEMGRVKKRRFPLYADLDNLIAKAAEMEDEEGSTDDDFMEGRDTDPLQIKKEAPKMRQDERESMRQIPTKKNPKIEFLEELEETFDNNPNGLHDEAMFDVNTDRKPKKLKLTNPPMYGGGSSSSSASPEGFHHSSKHSARKKRSSEPENSVELFFKSLAMEVNKAGLSSEKIFNLEWSVLKVVSEKIKEFTEGTTEGPPGV